MRMEGEMKISREPWAGTDSGGGGVELVRNSLRRPSGAVGSRASIDRWSSEKEEEKDWISMGIRLGLKRVTDFWTFCSDRISPKSMALVDGDSLPWKQA